MADGFPHGSCISGLRAPHGDRPQRDDCRIDSPCRSRTSVSVHTVGKDDVKASDPAVDRSERVVSVGQCGDGVADVDDQSQMCTPMHIPDAGGIKAGDLQLYGAIIQSDPDAFVAGVLDSMGIRVCYNSRRIKKRIGLSTKRSESQTQSVASEPLPLSHLLFESGLYRLVLVACFRLWPNRYSVGRQMSVHSAFT